MKNLEGTKIQITDTDIRRGVKSHPCLCPIARAVARATGYQMQQLSCGVITVYDEMVYVINDGYDVPRKVADFIARFDTGKPVKPFSFVLR